MQPPVVREETATPELTGMVDVLRRMIHQLHPPSVYPKYTLFQQRATPTQKEYWADIHLIGLAPDDARPCFFQGRSMATPALAYQMAAWEAIPRIRHSHVPAVGCPALTFFPSRHPTHSTPKFDLAKQERDPAITPLMYLLAAQHSLLCEVLNELAIHRKALSRLHDSIEHPDSDHLTLALSAPSLTPVKEAATVLDAPLDSFRPRHRLQTMKPKRHPGKPREEEGSTSRTTPKRPASEAIDLN